MTERDMGLSAPVPTWERLSDIAEEGHEGGSTAFHSAQKSEGGQWVLSLGTQQMDNGILGMAATKGVDREGIQLRPQRMQGLEDLQQLRALFAQAMARALSSMHGEPPTTAHLRIEVPMWGWVTLMVTVQREQVHVHAEASSQELGRQFAAATEGLQRMLNERQLRLAEVAVRTPETLVFGGSSHDRKQQGEMYQERAYFVRSFRWHRLHRVV
ncbi:MAG: flagellar hook-length control protein FliK [Candidatus Kapabacteria bacterium]|nr:flagellar hook-length control protein FliK [Candidatus Kapabacteria bacterium]MCS7169046.1 flagellar hook-length control protein FliK [Candidatus Kapabacteria bacterium]MDW7997769.1 flagellar hook-length control protein FliK [Bacteroidota bacterium]MDW8224723.1 flagellar hook-length control protein FliK [Bacteroidota bacterium]